jgi:hypothetical protein
VYEDDLFVANVLREIQAHDPSVPFFYYWAPHNLHAPLEVEREEEEGGRGRERGAEGEEEINKN